MIEDYFTRINHNSRHHDAFSSDWTTRHSSIDFAKTFLPYAETRQSKGVFIKDGAELLKEFSISADERFALVIFTYPNLVKANKSWLLVKSELLEVIFFIVIDAADQIVIHLRFGDKFKDELLKYITKFHPDSFVTEVEATEYHTNKESLYLLARTIKNIKSTAYNGFLAKLLLALKIIGLEKAFFETTEEAAKLIIKQNEDENKFTPHDVFTRIRLSTEGKNLEPLQQAFLATSEGRKTLIQAQKILEQMVAKFGKKIRIPHDEDGNNIHYGYGIGNEFTEGLRLSYNYITSKNNEISVYSVVCVWSSEQTKYSAIDDQD